MNNSKKPPKLPTLNEKIEIIVALAIFFLCAIGGELTKDPVWGMRFAGAMAACFVFLMYHVGKGLDENGGFDDIEDDGKDDKKDTK
jgi:hypothetical protein